MLKYKVSLEDEVIVDWSTIQGIVNQSRKFVKHGFDKLRNEHLQKLVSGDERPEGEAYEFCTLLAQIVTVLVNGRQPSEVSAALRDSEMFGAAKGETD
eukprot:gene7437-8926_t